MGYVLNTGRKLQYLLQQPIRFWCWRHFQKSHVCICTRTSDIATFGWRLCLWKVDWPSATELHSHRLRYHATPRTPVRDSACDVASDALLPQHAQHSARLEDNGTSLIVQVIKCVYDVRNYVISGLCKIFLATSHRETGSINDTRRSFSYFSFFS